MKIGVLTGGGDCPGLNAVIRAVVSASAQYHFKVVGIRDGWRGLMEMSCLPLTLDTVAGIFDKGGTILGTSRTNPAKIEGGIKHVIANIELLGIDCILAIGGDDTLGVASLLSDSGVNCVGVPKTIDNDLRGTDFTFGFNTAVTVVTEALDRLHTTTEAHHRVMVVEVMGRSAGWIATYGGLAGGANLILIPEVPFTIDEICRIILTRRDKGRYFSVIVVAEGATLKDVGETFSAEAKVDAFGHARLGGIAQFLASQIEQRTSVETRHVVLGHLQRGGSPTPFDRILATRFGVAAVELVRAARFGRMVALQGNSMVDISLKEATDKPKPVDMDIFKVAGIFFG